MLSNMLCGIHHCIVLHCRVHDSEFKDLPSLLFLLEQSHSRLAAVELRSMIFMPCTTPLIAKNIPQPNENDTLIAKNIPEPNENDTRETSLGMRMKTRKKNNLSSRYLTQIEEEVEEAVEKEVEKEVVKGVKKIGLDNTTLKGNINGINGMLMGHSGRELYGNSTPWFNNSDHDRNETSSYGSTEDRTIGVSVGVGVGVGGAGGGGEEKGGGGGEEGRGSGSRSGGGIGDGSLFNRIHNSIGK